MSVYFLKDFTYKGIKFEKETTYTIKNEMFARYLIRSKIAVGV